MDNMDMNFVATRLEKIQNSYATEVQLRCNSLLNLFLTTSDLIFQENTDNAGITTVPEAHQRK